MGQVEVSREYAGNCRTGGYDGDHCTEAFPVPPVGGEPVDYGSYSRTTESGDRFGLADEFV